MNKGRRFCTLTCTVWRPDVCVFVAIGTIRKDIDIYILHHKELHQCRG